MTQTLPALENLPALEGLPSVFTDAADRARTDGRLSPGTRRRHVNTGRAAFVNARKQSAADKIIDRLPEAGQVVHVCLDGAFDLCHLIPRIIDLAGQPAEIVALATLGFNRTTIGILTKLSDAGQVRRVRLLCSHYFKSVDVELFSHAHHELTKRGHTLYIARNHAKLQLYEFADGRTVTLMSSANLRSCKNAEFAVLFGDAATFRFWRSVVDELIEESRKCEAGSRA